MLSVVFLIILGLCIGSFLNVVIYRVPKEIDIVKGRSFCPSCKKKINWFDNVPLVSYGLLKGRCRFCRQPISLVYPLVEALTGILFVVLSLPYLANLSNLGFEEIIAWLLSLLLFSSLLVVFFIDLKEQIIPDKIIFPLIFLYVVYRFSINYSLFFQQYLLTAIGSFIFLFLIFVVTKGKGMGFGDVKLAFLMGLILGFPDIVVAFYVAFLTGALLGIILVLGKKAKFRQKIAFGPFLVLGTLVAYLWGEKIIALSQTIF